MTNQPLHGRKVAILLAPAGSEQAEFTEPKKAVEAAGAEVDVIGAEPGQARTYNHDLEPGETFTVDKAFGQVSADDYDALLVPGGTLPGWRGWPPPPRDHRRRPGSSPARSVPAAVHGQQPVPVRQRLLRAEPEHRIAHPRGGAVHEYHGRAATAGLVPHRHVHVAHDHSLIHRLCSHPDTSNFVSYLTQ
jgi:DJ-1/PfpI family